MNLVPITKETPTLELLRMYWECHRFIQWTGSLSSGRGDLIATEKTMREVNAELERRFAVEGSLPREVMIGGVRTRVVQLPDNRP